MPPVDSVQDGVMVVDTGEVDEDDNPVMREATIAEQNAAILEALQALGAV